jgi:hypothetical protein
MIHRNLISTLAVIICLFAFVSVPDGAPVPARKSTFSNGKPQVLPVDVSGNPRVVLPLASGEELPGADVFFHETFIDSPPLTPTERRNHR